MKVKIIIEQGMASLYLVPEHDHDHKALAIVKDMEPAFTNCTTSGLHWNEKVESFRVDFKPKEPTKLKRRRKPHNGFPLRNPSGLK